MSVQSPAILFGTFNSRPRQAKGGSNSAIPTVQYAEDSPSPKTRLQPETDTSHRQTVSPSADIYGDGSSQTLEPSNPSFTQAMEPQDLLRRATKKPPPVDMPAIPIGQSYNSTRVDQLIETRMEGLNAELAKLSPSVAKERAEIYIRHNLIPGAEIEATKKGLLRKKQYQLVKKS